MKNRKHSLTALLAAILCVAAVLSITAAASSGKPVQTDARAVTGTSYGIVDQSAAPQGRITFTASGQERCFILQGPDDQQAIFTAQENETIEIPLAGGTGRYQYAIAGLGSDGRTYSVQYKDRFTVSEPSADPVSAPSRG